jgi:tetratricopeptide (TPR) repeat protein
MDLRYGKTGVMSPEDAQASIDDITNLLKEYLDPHDQNMLLSYLSDIYKDSLHDNQSALITANKRIQIEGDQYDVWEDQGKILANLGNQTEATKSFAHGIELAQADIAREFEKNQKDYNDKQYPGEDDSYRKTSKEALDRDNTSTKQGEAYVALEIGRMYLMMGNNDDGRKWLNSATEWDTNPFMSVRPEAARLLKIIDQAQAQPPAQ